MAIFAWSEAKQLDDSLSSLDDFFAFPPKSVQTLTGGLTNRCWKIVDAEGVAYVWRPTTAITKAFSITRHQENQVLSAIELLKIAPKPILLNDKGLLVEWLEGETLSDGLELDRLLRTAISVHQVNTSRIPLTPFCFTARVDHYWFQLNEQHRVEPYKSIYQEWRSAPNVKGVDNALCHFDLGGYNLVKNQRGIQIIDWEYASLADPRLDLTLSIAVAQQPLLQSVYRYCQLRGIEDVDTWVEGVQAWLPRSQMMAMLWYLLAHQLWGDASYLEEAEALSHTFCR